MTTHACGFPWLVLAGLSLAAPAFAQDGRGPIDRLRDLARAGRHDEVVAEAEVLLDATPIDRRSLAWSIDFNHFPVEDVRIGRRYLYFQRMAGGGQGRPDLDPDPKRAPPGAGNYGWLISMSCVDSVTGRRLWSRYFLPGTRVALDPRDDALWTWHRDEGTFILRIDAATGDETLRRPMPPVREGVDAVRGLCVDGLRLWSYATANTLDLDLGDELDLDTGEVRRDLIHPALRALDGRRTLRCASLESPTDVTTTVMLLPDAARRPAAPDWSFNTRGYSDNPPVWFGDDVLILSGRSTTYGTVSRLDGRTGRVLWTHVLPEPAHSPGGISIGAGRYPVRGWSAVGEAVERVVALGANGTVFLLDPATGVEVARLATGMPLLAVPRVIEGRLVIAGHEGLRAVPLGRVIEAKEDRGNDAIALQEIRTRSLLALGRAAESLAGAEGMVRESDSPIGWTLLAAAREALGRGPEAVAPRVAAMAAAGDRESPALRKSHGLLWRLPTAPVIAAPLVLGPHLLVGCQNGCLLTIDTRSLRVLESEQAPTDITSLLIDGRTLVRRGSDRRDAVVRSLAAAPGDLRPHDPLLGRHEPSGLPAAWYAAMLGDGPSVAVGARRVRGLHNGIVRVLEGGEVIDRPPGVNGIEWWSITLVGNEPMGYGTGGVYRLDKDFRPVERIIDAGRSLNRPNWAFALDGDDTTLCVLCGAFDALKLQLWSRDATRLLREVPVRGAANLYGDAYHLRRLGDGYFVSAGELVWLPRRTTGRVWRFRIFLDPAAGPTRPQFDKFNAAFGMPRVVGDRLFVSARGGGLYGFNLPAITGMAGGSHAASGAWSSTTRAMTGSSP
jgi:hypothetical protein